MELHGGTSKKPRKDSQSRDFRRYLQQELIKRCEKNPQYSLRAFAKALGINHATLSSILAGKRNLTQKAVTKLCLALEVPHQAASAFVQHTPARRNAQSSSAAATSDYQELTLDTFICISEWYHDAMMEMTRIRGFRPDPRWIARSLGITVNQVKIAIERLIRLELLEIAADGSWIDLSQNNTTNISNDLTTAAFRKYQKKILEKSISALESLPRTERDHTSMTVAIQAKDLAEAKERIKKFRFELTAFFEREGTMPDSVFQLAVSLFPLTRSDELLKGTS